jgi:hypothetical protein
MMYKIDDSLYRHAGYVAWSLTALLIAMYGFVPFLVDYFELRSIWWADINMKFSIIFLIIHFFLLFIIVFSKIRMPYLSGILPHKVASYKLITVFFIMCLVVFYFFPWHSDRESTGSSFAAIGRVFWLYVCFSLIASSEKKKLLVFFLTLVLMYIDQSRTIFLLCIMFLAAASNHTKKILFLGIPLVIILAATRMGVDKGIIYMLYYGIFGEVYNAAYSLSQVSSISYNEIAAIEHIFGVLFQIFFLPISKLLGSFFVLPDFFYPQRILNEAVFVSLGEKLAPLGGWYLPAEFSYLGYFGMIFLALYYFFAVFLTRLFLGSNIFPFYLFFSFLLIKATPAVYFNMLLYIVIVFFILNQIRRIRWS